MNMSPHNVVAPATPGEVLQFLENLGIAHITTRHAPVFTVEESKALRGVIDGAHVKNLFLKDKMGRLFLVTALENAAIDLKTLHARLGATGRFSFASAEQLRAHWGVEPGSVTPLGAINDTENRVTVVLDEEMMRLDRINVHPLTNTMSTGLASADLLRFLDAVGHHPNICRVSSGSGDS
jgi:Ala-tRNA(Pro) deacylase